MDERTEWQRHFLSCSSQLKMIWSENKMPCAKNDLIQMGLCLQLHLKPALSLPQAKSRHGGVMCSHSAHLMQPCCDFFLRTRYETYIFVIWACLHSNNKCGRWYVLIYVYANIYKHIYMCIYKHFTKYVWISMHPCMLQLLHVIL